MNPYALHQPYGISTIAEPKKIEDELEFIIAAAWGVSDAIKTLFCELFFYQLNGFFIAPDKLLERFTRLCRICTKWQRTCKKWMEQPVSADTYADLEQFKRCLNHIKTSLLVLQIWLP